MAARATTNDLDLIEVVIRTASSPGYLLIGHAERVVRRDSHERHRVRRVPTYEDAAVHQLLHTRALSRGEDEQVRYGQRDGPATTVRVPKATAERAARWRSLKPVRH